MQLPIANHTKEEKKNSLKYPCLYRPDVKNITP